jgi:hypothetical protein
MRGSRLLHYNTPKVVKLGGAMQGEGLATMGETTMMLDRFKTTNLSRGILYHFTQKTPLRQHSHTHPFYIIDVLPASWVLFYPHNIDNVQYK